MAMHPKTVLTSVTRWRRYFSGLKPNVQGALWIILSSFMFSLMAVGVHETGKRLPSVEIVFIRTCFQLTFLMPLLLRAGVFGLKTSRWRMHIVRGLIGAVAIQCAFYALTAMPIADATAITFSRALFITIFAIIFLGEKVGVHRWSATIIGFVGILVMLRPDVNGLQPAALIALGGAACVAALGILVRMLSATETNEQIMMFAAVINLIVCTPFCIYLWVQPELRDIGIIGAAAVAGFVAQWSMIEGFRAGEASALAPISYTRLIFACILGYVLFAEVPTAATLIGAGLVVVAALYTIHRESIVKKRESV